MQMYFSAILHEVQQKSQDSTSTFRWYCHFDDDVYVNVPVLMRTLREHKDKQYLGHWHRNKRYPFHYASGAGYCISSSLMSQLEPFIRSDPTTCTQFKVVFSDCKLFYSTAVAVHLHPLVTRFSV